MTIFDLFIMVGCRVRVGGWSGGVKFEYPFMASVWLLGVLQYYSSSIEFVCYLAQTVKPTFRVSKKDTMDEPD